MTDTTPKPSSKTDPAANYAKRRSHSLAMIERVLTGYLRPYWRLLVLSVLFNIMVAVTVGVLPWLIQQTIDEVFNARNQEMLIWIPIGVIVVSLIRGGATFASNLIMAFVGQRSTANVQRDLFTRLVHGDLAAINRQHSGQYIAVFMNDTARLRDAFVQIIIALARHVLTIVALIGFMFTINWHMATIYTIIVVPLGIVSMRRLGKVTRKATRQGLEETGGMSTLLAETLSGLRIVKAYGQEDNQTTRAASTIDSVLKFTMRSTRARMMASPALEALAGIAVGVIIFYGGNQAIGGNLTSGEFIGFITALMAVYQPLRAVANMGSLLQEGVAAGTRIFAIIDQRDDIIDKPDAFALQVTDAHIAFENVSFAYPERGIPALQGVSLDVQTGETIALVGASGSGNSQIKACAAACWAACSIDFAQSGFALF